VDTDPSATVRLPRGVAVREIRPKDGDALDRFFQALSIESTQLRFCAAQPRLSAEELARFTTIDHADRDALAAVRGRDIVGVGRYDRIDTTDVAGVAVVVSELWQDRGVDAVLFHRLVERAQGRGIVGLKALVLTEHQQMLEVFQRSGIPLTVRVEDGVVLVDLSLAGRTATAGSDHVVGDRMRWHRTSVRYITRYRSTDARYIIESVGGSNARWHLRRQQATGSELVGTFASARDASAAAEADAADERTRHPDEPSTGI
jgi:GNAT superfamily N-acetyltransferase